MKEGYIEDTSGVPSESELKAINQLSRRNLSADEVFVFSVVLCDNEIDRDFERFSVEALYKMANLYVGKTGIFDHSMKGRDQVARVFECKVEKPAGQTTSYGEPYVCLRARAYMPKTDKNKDMIMEIDAGIKKEVSVGCAVEQVLCSICGANLKTDRCEHQKGRTYHRKGADQLCHHVLTDPTDAYEWSFVAVPAQRGAGVVKAYHKTPKGGTVMEPGDVVKALSLGQEITLSASQAEALSAWIDRLQKSAAVGQESTVALRQEVARLGCLTQPETDETLLRKMLGGLEYEELCEMQKAFTRQLDKIMPTHSQFEAAQSPEKPETETDFDTFMI